MEKINISNYYEERSEVRVNAMMVIIKTCMNQ